MTPATHRRAIIAGLQKLGWRYQPNDQDHLYKVIRSKRKGVRFWYKRQGRIVLMKNAFRMETLSDGTWVRIAGGYWHDCSVLQDGRVKLSSILVGQQSENSPGQ